jgi:pyridoxine kinase
VLVTSVREGLDRIGVAAVSAEANWFASTPLLEHVPHGAGDLLAALFLAERLEGRAVAQALERSVTGVFHVLAASCGSEELRLIEEQDALVDPPVVSELMLERI